MSKKYHDKPVRWLQNAKHFPLLPDAKNESSFSAHEFGIHNLPKKVFFWEETETDDIVRILSRFHKNYCCIVFCQTLGWVWFFFVVAVQGICSRLENTFLLLI